MKKVPIGEIQEKSNEEIISDLHACRYTLLDSMGCRKLRLEMFLPGKISAIFVRYLIWKAKRKSGKNWTTTVRSYIIKLFKKLAPYTFDRNDQMPLNSGGIVIGFNHPSLGEILRLIAIVSKQYPYNNYLFPVNLPWFEALCPVIDLMKEAGFILTPIVTPSTRAKIAKEAGEEMADFAMSANRGFNNTYINLCREFAENGDIILVAPSATRQRTVFKSDEELTMKQKIEPQTMSLIASALSRVKNIDRLQFLPVAVVPERKVKRGLNLRDLYCFGISKAFSALEAKQLSREKAGSSGGRMFDYAFLGRIAAKMFHMGNYALIAPLEDAEALDALGKILESTSGSAI